MAKLWCKRPFWTNFARTGALCECLGHRSGLFDRSFGPHHRNVPNQHRRSPPPERKGQMKIQKPAHVKLIPELFKKAGYYTCLGTIGHATGTINPKHKSRLGKSDYNFEWDLSVFDAGEWSGRKKGQPFFAKVCLSGGKARSQARSSKEIPHAEASGYASSLLSETPRGVGRLGGLLGHLQPDGQAGRADRGPLEKRRRI